MNMFLVALSVPVTPVPMLVHRPLIDALHLSLIEPRSTLLLHDTRRSVPRLKDQPKITDKLKDRMKRNIRRCRAFRDEEINM